MKRRIIALLCAFLMLVVVNTSCDEKEHKNLTKVRLNEVAHSVFYAPQYVAIELGYFEDEGLDVELTTGFGADKTMSALVAGEADIGFMGSESSIYLYNQGATDYAVNFAQLTQRAGNFLVAREDIPNFTWDCLKGKEVIGGRPGGMPEMVLEYILKLNGIDPKTDINLVQNIDFGNTSGAFVGGTGDFTIEFDPSATSIEQQNAGYVVASLGVDSGYVPYTAYCTLNSYIETDLETLTSIVDRYCQQDTWKDNLIFEETSFDLLQNILEESGELTERAPYNKLVTTKYAEEAVTQSK